MFRAILFTLLIRGISYTIRTPQLGCPICYFIQLSFFIIHKVTIIRTSTSGNHKRIKIYICKLEWSLTDIVRGASQ